MAGGTVWGGGDEGLEGGGGELGGSCENRSFTDTYKKYSFKSYYFSVYYSGVDYVNQVLIGGAGGFLAPTPSPPTPVRLYFKPDLQLALVT